MRRKQLGDPTRCFYCPETDIFCFEADHPVTHELDADFKRVECRNCHRKLEASRDLKELTKNGQHNAIESERKKDRRYHLLLAEDLDSIADVVKSPDASPEMTAAALRAAASSLRRTAPTPASPELPSGSIVAGVSGLRDPARRVE